MYWPTGTTRLVDASVPGGDGPIIRLKPSRRGNFFVTLTKDGLDVWDVRPTVMQAAVVRSPASLERFGTNVDVFWTYDGRGLIIQTHTSHLLFYQLVPTSRPSYDSPGPSTPGPGEGDVVMGWELRSLGTAFTMGGCESLVAQPHNLLVLLRHPPSLLSIPYPVPTQMLSPPGSHFPPPPLDGGADVQADCQIWDLSNARDWMEGDAELPAPGQLTASRTTGLPVVYTLLNQDGRLYAMYQASQLAQLATSEAQRAQLEAGPKYIGTRLHPPPVHQDMIKRVEALGLVEQQDGGSGDVQDWAEQVAINPRFGLAAVGLARCVRSASSGADRHSGKINIIKLPPWPAKPRLSHTLDLRVSANMRTSPGGVTSLSWTGDGYCLAASYETGWAAWSMGGRLGGWNVSEADTIQHDKRRSSGIVDLFWAPGNLELFMLRPAANTGPQIEIVSFVKSATTTQQSPDNTRYAFLQMDDRVLVYRGADQPDMSVINPESDVWQSIKIPAAYIATNWPVRFASISSDGKLIAVAGRRGLTHYSAVSGRWKLFPDERQEREFTVRGGLLWFHHVLIAAVDVEKTHQLRLYSRDTDLTEILHSQTLPSPVLVMTLLDNSLLVYTADNTLYHFLILPTQTSIKLHLCGSISFRGIVQVPSRVRGMSWMIPLAQKNLGDPADDLIVATIIFLVDGKLVLLRPRRARDDEVRYDMQVLADRIEAYWTHLHGVGTLENSLWGYDGLNMRIWLDALTIEATRVDSTSDLYENVEESVKLRLDFYPLSILMDKGIIIGVDPESSTRHLPWPIYKVSTGTHLFLPQFLRYHLTSSPPSVANALILASHFQHLVYFAHSLEILLHSVLEDEAAKPTPTATLAVDGIDPDSDPVEGTKPTLMDPLSVVITFLDYFPSALDVVVGCARKTEVDRWKILFDIVGSPRELFERCLEETKLRTAASYLLVLHGMEGVDDVEDTVRLLRRAIAEKEFHLCKELLRFLRSIDESGAALRAAVLETGIIDPNAEPSPLVPATEIMGDPGDSVVQPESEAASPSMSPPAIQVMESTPTDETPPEPVPAIGPGPFVRLRQDGNANGRIYSPFQLHADRLYRTPPSPRTIDRFEDQQE
ncbi:hypothetical protein IAU60_006371 [Kwoniella sp. DSM 27419]